MIVNWSLFCQEKNELDNNIEEERGKHLIKVKSGNQKVVKWDHMTRPLKGFVRVLYKSQIFNKDIVDEF